MIDYSRLDISGAEFANRLESDSESILNGVYPDSLAVDVMFAAETIRTLSGIGGGLFDTVTEVIKCCGESSILKIIAKYQYLVSLLDCELFDEDEMTEAEKKAYYKEKRKKKK